MNPKKIMVWVLLAVVCLGACTKYPEQKPQSGAAYLRVFNSLNYPDGTNGLPDEVTFLLDPVMDKSGLPVNAAVVGDYITKRTVFSSSYPVNAGNIGVTKQTEWPGAAPVLTAPTINGLDLSAWAQVPSGQHRIMLMGRPQADTPFTHLPASARGTIIGDTTVTLTAGDVYTLEAVMKDFVTNKTSAYLRDESFTKLPFTTLQNYLSFYSLTAANMYPTVGTDAFAPPLYIYYSLWSPVCTNTANTGVTTYACVWPAPAVSHVYLRSVGTDFATSAAFDSLPMPAQSTFLNPDGTFVDSNYRPYPQFDVYDGRGGYTSLYFGVSPDLPGYPFAYTGLPSIYFTQGLAIGASNSQQVQVYPSVNVVELINGTAYLMQMHRTFDPPIITN